MRIAIIYDSLFPVNSGGGERVYRRMAELLIERGHSVDYLTRLQWGATPPIAEFSLVPVWRGEIYDRDGSRTVTSALNFGRGVFSTLRKRRNNYDLVISSALPVLTLFAAKLALRGARTFLIADWLEVWPWSKWRDYSGWVSGSIAFMLQRMGVGLAHLNTADSRFTAERLTKYRPKESPLVHGLVDLVAGDHQVVTPANPPYILFVGRLIADKHADVIPGILQQARTRIPNLTAKIVGQGAEAARVAAEIERTGMSNYCTMLGRVSQDELDELFAEAAVLFNPSEREGFGLVVAEAAAFGVPSIVVEGSDNAATELISSGINGFIAPSIDRYIVAELINDVIAAGASLRDSTKEWFEHSRDSAGLAVSIDRMLARYSTPR